MKTKKEDKQRAENLTKLVHRKNVLQEKIFQYLIRCPAVQQCPVGTLREIAQRIQVIVSNDNYNFATKTIARHIDYGDLRDGNFILNIMDENIYEDNL